MDLSYAVVLLQQAIVLLDECGSENQWLTWAGEAKRYLRELSES